VNVVGPERTAVKEEGRLPGIAAAGVGAILGNAGGTAEIVTVIVKAVIEDVAAPVKTR